LERRKILTNETLSINLALKQLFFVLLSLGLYQWGWTLRIPQEEGLLGADQDDRYAFQLPPVAQALLKIACEMDLLIKTIHLDQVAREDLDLVGKVRPGRLCANHSPFPNSWMI
jgi:hypothetical protein